MSNDYPTTTRVLQKKPSESGFKQQKLPAWQPILTAGTVLPTFFAIGIAFIPIGIAIIFFSQGVDEIPVDYTDCISTTKVENSWKSCGDVIGDSRNNTQSCFCTKTFELNKDLQGKVYIYYGLTNFYQNHRRYVKSRDDVQLLGKLLEPSSDCAPYAYTTENGTKKPIAPCGAIANSMFNDEFQLFYNSSSLIEVPLLRTGIAWPSDKEIKFRNPPIPVNGTLETAFRGYAKPVDWKKNIWELDPGNDSNNGFQNEDFIVWMRTAALPNFRKLHRRVDHAQVPFQNGLPKGHYEMRITYSYPVKGFKGTKSFIVSTTSVLGAKNPFLGYSYITVGSLCLLVGIVFLVIHIKYGKSTVEVVNVTPTTSYQ